LTNNENLFIMKGLVCRQEMLRWGIHFKS